MPGWSQLVTLVSLDLVNTLVGAGYVTRTFPISGASNANPVVLTCVSPHGFIWPIHVVISGATGNTAINGVFIAAPISDTQLTLYSMAPDGTLSTVSGNGAYTGGATVSTALTDGKILTGRQHVFEASSAPRIVFVPVSSKWGPKSVYNRSNVQGSPSAEQMRQNQTRSLRTETTVFETHVWGIANPPDPDGGDFDATQTLYHQLIRSLHLLAPGNYNITDGIFTDQQASGSQLVRAGHEFVFSVTFDTPVFDGIVNPQGVVIPPLNFAPPGTAPGPILDGTYPGPGVYLRDSSGGNPQPA